jgi:4-amino-4-deoxy-L-arabinose transferase-like glycosyltransferase
VEQVLAGRVLTLLFAVVAILCVVRLGTRLRDARTGVLAGVFFATSPLVWYYGRGLQPDVPSLALALLALVLVDRAVTPEGVSWRFGLGSALALALGTLVKLPVIVFALPAVVLVVQRLGWKGLLRAPLTWVYGALVVGPTVAWYAYARGLQARHGLYHFFLGKPWRELVEDWGRGAFYESIFLKKLFDAYAFPLVSVAALLTLLVAWRRLAPWLRALGLATLAYFFLAGKHAEHHFYYGIPATPLLALAAADGVSRLVERLSRPLAARLLMGTLVLGALGYAHVRTRHMYAAPEAVATAERARGTLDAALAPDAKVALFSHADPTLLWFLDRRGWLVPPVDDPAAWFRASTVRPEALVVDPRRIDAAKRAALAEAFREAGYEPLLAEGPALWVRRPRQGS